MRGPFALEREMACTREDLLRWLPGATGDAPTRIDGDAIVLSVAGGEVRITTRVLPPRRIGLVSLPLLDVSFRFDGLDETDRDAFLARFDLHTRRGGG